MNSKSVVRFLALLTSILGLAAGLPAVEKAAAKPAVPVRKPVLKVDSSPIGDSKVVVTSYADALESIRPAVVSVYSSKMVRQQVPEFLRQYGLRGGEQKRTGLGSGVIISTDGFIITNNHVVEEADELKVTLTDGRDFIAKVIGTDPKTDVAVIKIEAENLPAATLADSARLRVGDVVFAIGNPLDIGQTVTMGIVSATGRHVGILEEVAGYEDFIQTDAAINQGNSGGALIDARGRLVGINSAIISTSSGNIGIGFAIPINLVSGIMHSLIDTGTVARGYMGVATDPNPLTPELAESFGLPRETRGVVVTDLNPPDGPAAKAGLKVDDIITAINDRSIASRDDLRFVIAQTPPDTKVTVKYFRKGKAQTAEITLGKMPEDSDLNGELLPGVTVTPLTGEMRRDLRIADRVDGLVITQIAPNSNFLAVFPLGAVIQEINSTPVTDLATARAALLVGRNRALIYYRGSNRYVLFIAR